MSMLHASRFANTIRDAIICDRVEHVGPSLGQQLTLGIHILEQISQLLLPLRQPGQHQADVCRTMVFNYEAFHCLL